MENISEQAMLTVRTGDKASENFILDNQFRRVGYDVGEESFFTLPKGLYSVKVKVGTEWEIKPFALLENKVVHFDPIDFSSPAPLEKTHRTTDLQVRIATEYSKKQHPDLTMGSGSKIFLFGTLYSNMNAADMPEVNKDPAIGLTLRDDRDEILVDFGKPDVGTFNWEGQPWAACTVDIDPGVYNLCLTTVNGDTYKQTIAACEGWQTQIFMEPKNYGLKEKDVRADLVHSSIFMSRIGEGFDGAYRTDQPSGKDFRLTEQVRQALALRRSAVGKKMAATVFSDDFENPMLGIYTAHLLLLDKKFDTAKLNTLVTKLRSLVGTSHPDVEAIALKAGMSSNYVFKTFPMLANSWKFVLEASFKNPAIVPPGTVAYNFAGHFLNEDLWLIWGKLNDTRVNYVAASLQRLVETELWNSLQRNKLYSLLEKIMPSRLLNRLMGHKGSITSVLNYLGTGKLLAIALMLDIPQSKIEALLKPVRLDELAAAIKKTKNEPSNGVQRGLQNDEFEEKHEVHGRKISATVEEGSNRHNRKIIVTVESTDSNQPLTGNVKFHLPQSFLHPDPEVAVSEGKAILKLTGLLLDFPVRAETDNDSAQLVLNLAKLQAPPKK
jgi:hypothetical protein